MYQEMNSQVEDVNIHPDRQQYMSTRGGSRDRRGRGGRSGYNRRNNEQVISPHDSILHTEWIEPGRPYSQKELQNMEDILLSKLQIDSDVVVHHQECDH